MLSNIEMPIICSQPLQIVMENIWMNSTETQTLVEKDPWPWDKTSPWNQNKLRKGRLSRKWHSQLLKVRWAQHQSIPAGNVMQSVWTQCGWPLWKSHSCDIEQSRLCLCGWIFFFLDEQSRCQKKKKTSALQGWSVLEQDAESRPKPGSLQLLTLTFENRPKKPIVLMEIQTTDYYIYYNQSDERRNERSQSDNHEWMAQFP